MDTTGKYLPLDTGSLIFWETDTTSPNPRDWDKRGIRFVTEYRSYGSLGGEFEFHSSGQWGEEISGITFSLPNPKSLNFAFILKSVAKDVIHALNGGNLLIRYPAEKEDELEELLTLFSLSHNPNVDISIISADDSIFGKRRDEWKKEFVSVSFQFFKDKIQSNAKIVEVAKPKLEEKVVEAISKLETVSSPKLDHLHPIKEPPLEPKEPQPISNAEIPQEIPPSSSIVSNEVETSVTETPTSDLGVATPKFSIQLKLMGIISLILAGTVSTIIALATYYFKDDAEKRVQVNNLAIVELVGLKVGSDIQTIVAKAEQLVSSSIRPNLLEEDKRFINNLFFSNDKDFVFVGLYGKSDDELVSQRRFLSEDNLIDSNITEEDINASIERNKETILKAFLGKPVVMNTTPGFPIPSFILALPANIQENDKSKILIIKVKLEKILPAFEKKDITTTFMVSEDGRVIAHPVEEVVLAAPNFMDMPIVQSLLTSQVDTGQLRYIAKDGSPFLGSYRKVGFGDSGIISIVSENKAFEEVYNLQERNLYIMAISLCLALIIVFVFAKSLTRPILNLLTATLEIARGNFKVGIKPTTKDEVGLLTNYFIQMGEGLEEREKVKSILGSMIDPVVVQEAMVDLAALKRGKEAEITSFFSDVAGFSTISEQLTSVELASLLNEYLSAMTIILKDNEGVLDKYIGDAIVGIFGAPVTVESHAQKACKASLEMIMKLEELRQYWQKNNLYSKEAQIMDARIGLNTGPAKVGFMGTDALASYTMMGDTVNLAARLEAAGKDYGVNIMIAENTFQLVKDDFEIRILDLIRVKGKNEPVRVYELVGFKNSLDSSILDSIGSYKEGFNNYLNQNWDKAIQNFETAYKSKGGKDKSASMLIERCKAYKQNSPGKSWDGVFTRTTK